jgi:hypothetical protein
MHKIAEHGHHKIQCILARNPAPGKDKFSWLNNAQEETKLKSSGIIPDK